MGRKQCVFNTSGRPSAVSPSLTNTSGGMAVSPVAHSGPWGQHLPCPQQGVPT